MKKTAILKRVICVIAILALALTCFACGEKTPSQGDEPSKSNDEQPNNGETIELEFWLVGTEEDKMCIRDSTKSVCRIKRYSGHKRTGRSLVDYRLQPAAISID